MIGGISNEWAGGPMNIAEIDWTDWKDHCVMKRIAGRMEDEGGTNRGRVGDEWGTNGGRMGWEARFRNWDELGRIGTNQNRPL